jgi:hypothetical protein
MPHHVAAMARDLKGINFGAPLDDPRLRWASFEDGDTVLGYDFAVVRLTGVLSAFRQGEDVFAARKTVDGVVKPAEQGRKAMERLLGRRRREFDEFVAQGKVLVVFLAAPEEYAVFTHKETRTDAKGDESPVRMHEIRTTIEQALPIELEVEALRGDALELTASAPFAEFWAEWGEIFHHEAVIAEHPGVTAVQITGTNKAVAAIVRHGSGVVLLLPDFEEFEFLDRPAPKDGINPAHAKLIDALLELGQRLTAIEELPDWSNQIKLPGEKLAQSRFTAAEKKIEDWQLAAAQRAEGLRDVRRRKGLFTASGAGLETLAEEAFSALGFEVEQGAAGRADRILRLGDQVAVVEIKGRKGSGREQDAAQLNKWVADYHAKHGKQPKGILVVNVFCQTPLKERTKDPFPQQMHPFAVDQQRFCLITGEQLLAAWLEADADPTSRDRLAISILACVGVYDGPGIL